MKGCFNMNKKGFTLMELLLVVAVLAIVAAAAAPTFFGGAQEALNEAKKSNMNAAYQNALTGANIMLGIAASKGITLAGNLDNTQTGFDKTLADYTPISARTFKADGGTFVFGAQMTTNGKTLLVGYLKVEGEATPTGTLTTIGAEGNNASEIATALDTAWNNVFNKKPQN